MDVGPRLLASIAFVVGVAVASGGCGDQPSASDDHGITPCPQAASNDLLSAEALQCWFTAPHGRWRTLSHQSAFGALVVQVEAHDLADAEEIAGRFVEKRRGSPSEISVYVQGEGASDPTEIRRVTWTPERGYTVLEFTAPRAR